MGRPYQSTRDGRLTGGVRPPFERLKTLSYQPLVLCQKPIETTGPPVEYSTVHPPLDPLVSRHHHQAGSSSSGQIVRRLTVGNSRPLRPSESLPGQPVHLTAPGGFWTTTRAARASNHRSSSAGEAIELGSQVERQVRYTSSCTQNRVRNNPHPTPRMSVRRTVFCPCTSRNAKCM